MKKNVNEQKNKIPSNDILELVGGLIFGLWFFLLFIPAFFTFQSATITGKVFMIIGSVLFVTVQILFILCIEKLYKKNNNDKKSLLYLRIFYVASFIFYVYLLLRYFDDNIWGSFDIVVSLGFLFGVLYGSYCLILHFKLFFNSEKIPMLLTAIAIFLCWLGGLFLDSNFQTSYLLFKIAIGILYLIFIAIFLNLTVFNLFNYNNKRFQLLRILICVAIPLVILITIPFYVQWCGLNGDNFDTFVTVYSAVSGGGLTLIGVAWTIKQSDMIRKNEEIIKYKPYVVFYNSKAIKYPKFKENYVENNFIKYNETNINNKIYIINNFTLHNTEKAPLIFKGFLFNKKHVFKRNSDLFKNKNTLFKFNFSDIKLYLSEQVDFISIVISDINYNLYTLDLKFKLEKTSEDTTTLTIIESTNLQRYYEEY